ncbi:T9SS type A sorting domain-containing protein [Flavobacterium antarcticum]|uniref:T9SS type A sorting domain-containing protein n=1 Tax=Flavobacterium antarcticum TaxID=271155 RepID=UPI0003B2F2E9|nr:T9SS type A sorting domain-containing protein [Flavobacterium antarcticum]
MKKVYILLMAVASSFSFAQESISFESSEGYALGTLHGQNGWEVTQGSDGLIQNQVITNEQASTGTFSFKNAHEPSFDEQWFPIFGAVKTFATPLDHTNLTFSYDVKASAKNGADFEFVLYSIDADDEFTPVAGVGIENRGYIYLIKNDSYGFDYAEAEWTPNVWVNIKIEISAVEIKYYVNNVLQNTIANFTQLDVLGFNMLHNNYGNDAYYDNFVITSNNLNINPFESNSVAVYPNPATDLISIAGPTDTQISQISIYNVRGQEVLKTNVTQNINVSELTAGTYFLKATSTNGATLTKKIIKN